MLIPFENCLPQSYQSNIPTPLQWVPSAVDAVFDTENSSHNLQVIMWGNVAGSWSQVTLPPPNSPDWTDPTKLDGKILREPDSNSADPHITTLHSKVNVLTYEPWNQAYDFCETSLVNGTCPLAPVFNLSTPCVPLHV